MIKYTLRFASSIVFVESLNGTVAPSTLSTISAASKIGPITCLVASNSPDPIVNALKSAANVSKILVAKHSDYQHLLPELMAPLLVQVCKQEKVSHLFAAHSTVGKNIIPRASALLNSAQVSDIISVESNDTFIRPIYAGNAFQKVKSNDKVIVVTIRPTSFPQSSLQGGNPSVSDAPVVSVTSKLQWVSDQLIKNDRPEIGSAKIIISGGRALKSAENFNLLYALADKMGAAVGASRAAVDAGYVPNDLQIGQTGKIVAPQLYIGVGVSGAIQHLAGMKDSKTIVAINTDAEAPIFQVADYGLVADLFKAVPEMTQKLTK